MASFTAFLITVLLSTLAIFQDPKDVGPTSVISQENTGAYEVGRGENAGAHPRFSESVSVTNILTQAREGDCYSAFDVYLGVVHCVPVYGTCAPGFRSVSKYPGYGCSNMYCCRKG